jgi:hypothetical protein
MSGFSDESKVVFFFIYDCISFYLCKKKIFREEEIVLPINQSLLMLYMLNAVVRNPKRTKALV